MSSFNTKNAFEFGEILLNWYSKNKRDLPWRANTEPYKVWISEIILQQTRVAQGLEYFNRIIKRFPTIQNLANANEDEVLKFWQGLGYYSRARNMHFTAKYITQNLNGVFPSTYKEIIKLKGIGPYTAAAISSISFNEPNAVVDGNVIRVLSRVFGIKDDIINSKGKKTFNSKANELLVTSEPGDYNQAIMEFGALQCVPQNPICNQCPLKDLCFAYLFKQVQSLPTKSISLKKKNRYFDFLVIEQDDKYLLSKREGNDIYKGLFTFPFIENNDKPTNKSIADSIKTFVPFTKFSFKNIPYQKHILSHQLLQYRFHFISNYNRKHSLKNNSAFSVIELKELPIPKILESTVDLLTKHNLTS